MAVSIVSATDRSTEGTNGRKYKQEKSDDGWLSYFPLKYELVGARNFVTRNEPKTTNCYKDRRALSVQSLVMYQQLFSSVPFLVSFLMLLLSRSRNSSFAPATILG